MTFTKTSACEGTSACPVTRTEPSRSRVTWRRETSRGVGRPAETTRRVAEGAGPEELQLSGGAEEACGARRRHRRTCPATWPAGSTALGSTRHGAPDLAVRRVADDVAADRGVANARSTGQGSCASVGDTARTSACPDVLSETVDPIGTAPGCHVTVARASGETTAPASAGLRDGRARHRRRDRRGDDGGCRRRRRGGRAALAGRGDDERDRRADVVGRERVRRRGRADDRGALRAGRRRSAATGTRTRSASPSRCRPTRVSVCPACTVPRDRRRATSRPAASPCRRRRRPRRSRASSPPRFRRTPAP